MVERQRTMRTKDKAGSGGREGRVGSRRGARSEHGAASTTTDDGSAREHVAADVCTGGGNPSLLAALVSLL